MRTMVPALPKAGRVCRKVPLSRALPLTPLRKRARGGTMWGGWSLLNPFHHCRHGRISPPPLSRLLMNGSRAAGMAARRVRPLAEDWDELEVAISGFLFCSTLLVFDSFIIFYFPSSGGNRLMGKGRQSPGEGRNHERSTREAARCARSVCSVSSAAQLTPHSCTFCRWAGYPPVGGNTAVSFCWCSGKELEACLSVPSTPSRAGRARSRGGLWERELSCFVSRPLKIISLGLKGCFKI